MARTGGARSSGDSWDLASSVGTTATMVAAATSEWFDSTSFRTEYAAGLLTRMSDEAAAAFIQSQRVLLDAEIRQETSVHLQTPLQL